MKKYVDVIVPLPLEGCFTYACAEGWADSVKPGCRVVVPFGRKKFYTAVVLRVHGVCPQGYVVKEAVELLDEVPVLLPLQLRFWEWLADYYLCSLGDVMKAALPSGMKPEGSKPDELTGGFKPKLEARVRLCEAVAQEEALHRCFDSLQRAHKQLDVLMKYLELSGFLAGGELREVSKAELLLRAGASASVLSALVEKGILRIYEEEVGRLGRTDVVSDGGPVSPLSAAQQRALEEVNGAFAEKQVCLLHGVTGSGKTEVYIHRMKQALAEGKQVLYLLPEIALTTQITERLRRVFGAKLGVYHSKFPDAERVEIWRKQLSDEPYEVILGVRSSVFLPFVRLGLVIVDEEHEATYKQQDPAPRYHARNAAMVLASYYGAKTLLGTATPSVESWQHARSGKYGWVELKERYREMQLPEILPVDIRELHRKKRMVGPFSPLLIRYMREALERGEQVILFQNRRGFAPMIECNTCGWVPRCAQCDVSLTYHRGMNRMTCHYCGAVYEVTRVCPACGGTDLRHRGFGTEKIEEDVKVVFPEARVARMDLDTTRTRTAYEQIIEDFEQQRTDVLIGTQMVSKGLDFDHVSVVGILNADTMMNFPDFRAYERAFQLMAQVAGRAGRKNRRGVVVLQTKSVDHPIIPQVRENAFEAMVEGQLAERQLFRYPPFYRLVYVYVKHREEALAEALARRMADRLRSVLGDRVLGPDQPAVARVQTLFIRKVMVKVEVQAPLHKVRELLRSVQAEVLKEPRFRSAAVYYDVDPM